MYGQKTKTLHEISLKLLVGNNNIISNLLVDGKLSLDFSVKHLSKVVQGLRNDDYEMAADFSKMNGNTIKVDGLISIDVIQYMESLRRINCLRVVASQKNPLGDVSAFYQL